MVWTFNVEMGARWLLNASSRLDKSIVMRNLLVSERAHDKSHFIPSGKKDGCGGTSSRWIRGKLSPSSISQPISGHDLGQPSLDAEEWHTSTKITGSPLNQQSTDAVSHTSILPEQVLCATLPLWPNTQGKRVGSRRLRVG